MSYVSTQSRSSLGLVHTRYTAICQFHHNWYKVIRISPMKAEISRALEHFVIVDYSKWCFLAMLKLLKAQDSSLVLLEISFSQPNRTTVKDSACCVWINQSNLGPSFSSSMPALLEAQMVAPDDWKLRQWAPLSRNWVKFKKRHFQGVLSGKEA